MNWTVSQTNYKLERKREEKILYIPITMRELRQTHWFDWFSTFNLFFAYITIHAALRYSADFQCIFN